MIDKVNEHYIQLAKDTLDIETQGINQLFDKFADLQFQQSFTQAVELLLHCQGRLVVSGIGKSGHIANKIAATFSSTGSPAFFVHPAEASHGDLGMIQKEDVFLALSYSGETAELLTIVPLIKRMGAKFIAMTGNPHSKLAEFADVHLDVSVAKEACPLNLAPTTSTTVSLVMGDALAVVLLDTKNFSADDFARSHPGGSLGKRLLTHVRDVMRSGDDVPKTHIKAPLKDALIEISKKRLGMTVIVDSADQVLGIFTDGDLRRLLEKTRDLDSIDLKDVMTSNPKTISKNILAAEAAQMMERFRINHLIVVSENGTIEGALNLHDLLASKII
ncbi:MAG: KpsF/GutQ family sugar-phosphate isomerase [Betaproteobacteria bacterium]|jgi:arabinose-5-phosphate isomerase